MIVAEPTSRLRDFHDGLVDADGVGDIPDRQIIARARSVNASVPDPKEQIQQGAAGDDAIRVLSWLDVLVDGPFLNELKSDQVIFRGSTNQRLIDVPASLKCGHVTEYIYTS